MKSFLRPGPLPAWPALLDERSRPDFRDAFGGLASRARALDLAVTRIRLTTLDLERAELQHLEHIRLLLADVSAPLLDAEAHAVLAGHARADTLRHLIERLRQGRIQVRAAPLGGWSPDFTVFVGPEGPAAALIGPHWLERPYPFRGPAFATWHGPGPAARVHARFVELWRRAHDIAPALRTLLDRTERALPRGSSAGPPAGPWNGTSTASRHSVDTPRGIG